MKQHESWPQLFESFFGSKYGSNIQAQMMPPRDTEGWWCKGGHYEFQCQKLVVVLQFIAVTHAWEIKQHTTQMDKTACIPDFDSI